MRNTVIWSFLSMVALASSGLIAGCDSDEKLAKSALGESCDKTSDCADGLKCLQGACYQTSSSSGGSSNEGGDGSGGTVIGPKPPVLGGEGESCTKRADCEDGLGCFNERCMAEGGGEGGSNTGATLGGVGETCGLSSDCASGLSCLPSDSVFLPTVLAAGSNTVGVCYPTDNGLEPTGKACGAECLDATDCCELPYEIHAQIGAESCTELAGLLDGVDCATTKVAQSLAQCFAQSAYCECGKNTWACDAGTCRYTAACSKANTLDAPAPGGCPQYSRSGFVFTSTCDTTGSKKCQPAAGEPVCKTDAQCTDKPVTVAGGAGVATCAEGECTCYKETGLCYRKCEEDLDCPANYACDKDTSVCLPEAGCQSDAECVTRTNNIKAKCFDDGLCEATCDNDLDCNGGYLTNGANTRICNAEHRCQLVGCTTDRECGATVGGLRIFCADKPEVDVTGVPTSAITD
jgi:hypothetical protein